MPYRMKFQDLLREVNPESEPFPKYTSQLINLANRNAQGTRPKVVGKVTDLIQEFPGKSYGDWVKWYTEQYPASIDNATVRICDMLPKLGRALEEINPLLVHRWVTDLVLGKTFVGLRCQEVILRNLATMRGISFRPATAQEESRGIDGFLDDRPVSVKPHTYRSMPMLSENITATIIFYKKEKNSLIVEFDF